MELSLSELRLVDEALFALWLEGRSAEGLEELRERVRSARSLGAKPNSKRPGERTG